MFEYVHLKNFKSFGDITIDMTDKHGLPKKLILIYGENGIGKSNLASAFLFLGETLRSMNVRDFFESFIANYSTEIDNETISQYLKERYRDLETLIKSNKMVDSDDNMLVEYGFRINGHKGRYIIETNNTQAVHERLEYTLSKNRGTVFDITPNKITINSKAFIARDAYKEIITSCRRFWGKHTFLSILMHESDDKSEQFIKENISDNFKDVLHFLSRLSCKVDTGTFMEKNGIAIPRGMVSTFSDGRIDKSNESYLDNTEKMLNLFFKNAFRDVKEVYYKRTYEENYVDYELVERKMIAGKVRTLDFSYESTGTQSLIEMLPYLIVSTFGSAAVIDEFETGLHNMLAEKILESVYSNIKGQLILTTHNTHLMTANIPKDTIYVIRNIGNGNKDVEKITSIDKNTNINTNPEKQYFSGSYNGIPDNAEINFKKYLCKLGL